MFAFSRTCSPNICIEKLFSALPASGDPPKRIFGKSSHKPCPVMLGEERKCRKSSHKAREKVRKWKPILRDEVREGWCGKRFSGKDSIVSQRAMSGLQFSDFVSIKKQPRSQRRFRGLTAFFETEKPRALLLVPVAHIERGRDEIQRQEHGEEESACLVHFLR